jgi:7-alpha-hydroxysteroid dehydrogenase
MPDTSTERFGLEGKVAIITGAGKGIGAAIARVFAQAGADCVLTARSESDLEAVADDVTELGRQALVLAADVNDLDALAGIVSRTVGELGGIDIIVNNAGGSMSRPFLDTTVAQLEKSFHFNVSAPFELVRLAVPHMLERGSGVVCNIGSVAGRNAVRNSLTHSLTKAALEQLTRLMAVELAPRIRVNGVLPGAVETDSLRLYLSAMDPSIREAMHANTAMRRNGLPEDIADAVLYLCSPAASWVTGQCLAVDGMANGDLIPKLTTDL